MPFNVSSEINITDGMVTGAKNYRTNVAWADDAKSGDFVQGCIGDSVITFTFGFGFRLNAKLTLTGASGWVLVYDGTPVELGDMVAAEMFDLEVNGQIVTIDPDAKFTAATTARRPTIIWRYGATPNSARSRSKRAQTPCGSSSRITNTETGTRTKALRLPTSTI